MNEFRIQDVLASYNRLAPEIVPDYERLSFETHHPAALDLLPENPALILDVGAGTGRDAAWFAAKGHDVVALEPSRELRLAGQELHQSPRITWIDDRLPDLGKLLKTKSTFDLVWLSAMWMHVPPGDRELAFQALISVTKPGGSLMFRLRLGPLPPDRPMAPVSAAEIEELARIHAIEIVRVARHGDAAGRPEISWDMVWLRSKDPGRAETPA